MQEGGQTQAFCSGFQDAKPSLLVLLQCKTDEEGRFSFSVSTCEQVTPKGEAGELSAVKACSAAAGTSLAARSSPVIS